MKKLLLLLAGGMIVFGADAQYVKPNASVAPTKRTPSLIAPNPRAASAAVPHHSTFRTTGTPFYTEDFSGGSYTLGPPFVDVLPPGWTAGIISGPGTWHWADYPSHAMYSIGAINSTTASNGWMIFDSDSLGGAGTTSVVPAGWMESPHIDCSSYNTVQLEFEEYFQEFNGDSCSIWVSTDSTFATYTDYPVAYNDALGGNQPTPNPYTVQMNITPTAAHQATVFIRYVYYGTAGGDYQWMVDDMALDTLFSNDVGISGSFLYLPDATAYNGTLLNTPLIMVDSVYPITQLTDYGAAAETNIPVTATIYKNGTSVYTNTVTYASLPLNALDSFVQGYTSYFPTDTGSYLCAFHAILASDSNTINNYDSVSFTITDTLWMQNQGNITGGYYCHESGATPVSYFDGVRFDVPSNSPGDTVTGFGVVFDPQSSVTSGTATVSVQLYSIQQGGSGWAYQATSFARAITSADISNTTAVWAYFGIDIVASGGISQFVLQPGTTYAAMIQMNGVTTQLIVDATAVPNVTPAIGSFFGQNDTSMDDGGQTFGSTIQTGIAGGVPMVRMYLGKVILPNGVQNINGNVNTVNAFPNPAANVLNVSFNEANTGNVTVSLTDVIGQTVATQNFANVNNGKAVFNTAALPDGVYIYTLDANGEHTTGHVVIAH